MLGRIYLQLILFSSSNWKYQFYPLLSYFSWLSAWGGCTIICCPFHMYPGKADFVSFITVYFNDACNDACSDTLWPDVRIRLFLLYTTSLSSSCRYIWRYWTPNILVRYILSSVCIRLSQFCPLSFMPYRGLCVFSLSRSLAMILRIYVRHLIFFITSEVWPTCSVLTSRNILP